MAVVAFDTFTIAQDFEKAGFPKEQVAVLTKALTLVRLDPEAVSKAELKAHEAKVDAKSEKVEAKVEKYESKILQAIADLRKDIQHEISDLRKDNELLRSDITWIKWILSVSVAGIFMPLLKGMFQ